MKTLFSILTIFCVLSMTSVCYAEETTEAIQSVNVEKSGAVFKIQKQPMAGKSTQTVNVSKSGLCVIIQVNGKVKENDNTISK